MTRGIVLQADSAEARRLAKRQGLPVEVRAGYALPWERTLFLAPSVRVPWGLLPRGFDFVQTWDAAAPVWSYETLAAHVAAGAERKRAEALIGDLRVPLYEQGLLFVRNSAGGRALVEVFDQECAAGGDERLAFLRALYVAKPCFWALPRSWLLGKAAAISRPARRHEADRQPVDMVRVEVTPGRFVRCRPEEAEALRARYQAARARLERRGRRGSGNG